MLILVNVLSAELNCADDKVSEDPPSSCRTDPVSVTASAPAEAQACDTTSFALEFHPLLQRTRSHLFVLPDRVAGQTDPE